MFLKSGFLKCGYDEIVSFYRVAAKLQKTNKSYKLLVCV